MQEDYSDRIYSLLTIAYGKKEADEFMSRYKMQEMVRGL